MSGSVTEATRDLSSGAGVFGVRKVAPNGWSFWTVGVRLRDGGCAVYSPTSGLSPEGVGAFEDPRFLLAPNHFHYLGLPEWIGRSPAVRPVSSAQARPRIEAKSGVALGPLDALVEALPDHVQLLEPAGSGAGEIFVRAETATGVLWVVCDAFFHLPAHPTGFFGLMCRLSGTSAGLRIGGTLPLLHLSDRKAYKAWLLDRLAEDRPTTLVPSHGEPVTGEDLPERLRALAEHRL